MANNKIINKAVKKYKKGEAERKRKRQVRELAFHLKGLKEGV